MTVNSVAKSLLAVILNPSAASLERSKPPKPLAESRVELPSLPSYCTDKNDCPLLGVASTNSSPLAPAEKSAFTDPRTVLKIISLSPPIIEVSISNPDDTGGVAGGTACLS